MSASAVPRHRTIELALRMRIVWFDVEGSELNSIR